MQVDLFPNQEGGAELHWRSQRAAAVFPLFSPL